MQENIFKLKYCKESEAKMNTTQYKKEDDIIYQMPKRKRVSKVKTGFRGWFMVCFLFVFVLGCFLYSAEITGVFSELFAQKNDGIKHEYEEP